MCISKHIVIGLITLPPLMAAQTHSQDLCAAQMPSHQQHDQGTIEKIETAWNLAIARGDSSFERCLLTPDFTEILSKGEVKTLTDELGFTEKNKGKNRPVPNLPPITVLTHGNLAVAYATWSPIDPKKKSDRTTDFFIWASDSWRVVFSQATPIDDQ